MTPLCLSGLEIRSPDLISRSLKHCVKSLCLMASYPQRVGLKSFFSAAESAACVCVQEEEECGINVHRYLITP